MIDVVAIIPARGGSKGVPRKNLAPLGGRPLIAHTIEAARAARSVGRVLVSTDDDEIAAVSAALGAEVVRRPAGLAADDSPAIDVVVHALSWLGTPEPDAVAYLQPTSPLRPASAIDDAIALLESRGADAVVGVTAVPHRFSPGSLLRTGDDGWLEPLDPAAPRRRQDKPTLLARNGPAVLVVRAAIARGGELYPARTIGLEMSTLDSIDIDDADDLILAEALLAHRRRAR